MKKLWKQSPRFFLVIVALYFSSVLMATADAPEIIGRKAVWQAYSLSDVRLADGSYFKQLQDQHRQYLLSLSAERLINNVMRAGGLATTATNYGGWQHNNGNGFGNYISGCSMMYAATGDETLRSRVRWMIDVIDTCQRTENLGGWFHFSRTKGFYEQLMGARGSGCAPVNNGEDFYTNSDMAGMVFYQLHRIFYGIRDAWRYAGIEKAREVFLKCMEWACTWTENIQSDASLQMALEAEHGGMTELFMDAYAMTGDERFLKCGRRWIQTLNFRDKMAEGTDVLTSRHANVYDPKFMGLLRAYELEGDEENRRAVMNAMEWVTGRHIFAMGGHGRWERYGTEGRILDELSNTSAETCCTNNMLRFSKAMFEDFGDERYMDFYERALYNHILASKDPDNNSVGGGFCYYQSLLPGMYRKYMDDSSFYCCWETGLENPSKYGEAIFFHNAAGNILVNLFIPSVLHDEAQGLMIQMSGDYPNDNTVTLQIIENKSFAGHLCFRIPSWMDGSRLRAMVNGRDASVSADGELLHRVSVGDVIALSLPVGLRWEGTEEPDVASIFYGPVLLCPNMGRVSGDYVSDVWQQTSMDEPTDFPKLHGERDLLADWMEREDGQLLFHADGLTFLPFYKSHHMRTSIYQRFVSERDQTKARRYVSDRIDIGRDTSHNFSGRGAFTGKTYNRYCLSVKASGRFSYDMQLSPEPDDEHYVALQANGWETDTVGNYAVYIDDEPIGDAGPCERIRQFTFPWTFFRIPRHLTEGKSSVRLKITQGSRPMTFFAIEIVTERYLREMCPESRYVYGSEPVTLRLEAENAQPHGDNRTFDGKSSGGAYVSRLSSYLLYGSIYFPQTCDYKLRICYRGSAGITYTVKVGDLETKVRLEAHPDEWGFCEVPVSIDKGFNTIKLSPDTKRTPLDIDFIELVPSGEDLSSIETLPRGLPEDFSQTLPQGKGTLPARPSSPCEWSGDVFNLKGQRVESGYKGIVVLGREKTLFR